MGDVSASDGSWNKMVLSKSNKNWISKMILVNVGHIMAQQEIKQEIDDSDQQPYSEIDEDRQCDDTTPESEQVVKKSQRLRKKGIPKSDSIVLDTPKCPTKKKPRKNSIARAKNETPEERAERLARMSAYAARRLANETPEQRSLRLRRMSEYAARRLSQESPEQRARRLSRMSAYAAQRLANETPEQRNARLSRMSAYAAKRQAIRKTKSINNDQLSNTELDHS